MLTILYKKADVHRAQQLFAEKFRPYVDDKISVIIGYHGGSEEAIISWASKFNIWAHFGRIEKNRYWNAFGIGKPKKGSYVPITCEINFPLSDIDRRVAGAFAKDNLGSLFVVHRGKIGGGRKDIGKSSFFKNYQGSLITVQDDNIETTVALIGALNSPRFVHQVCQFVFEVERIKSAVLSPTSKPTVLPDDIEFKDEFVGRKRYKVGKNIEAECDHGLVVNGLFSALKNLGFVVGNDRNRDLYIVNSNSKITSVFEIKTDIALTSLYSAVGQLLLNSVTLPKRPKLFLVIPEKPSKLVEAKLNRLGLELLLFGWRKDKVIFPKLNSRFRGQA